jgi:hypothetical protein
MSVTFTDVVTGAGLRPLRAMCSMGDLKIAFKNVTLSAIYGSAGDPCDLATECGMSEVLFVFPTLAVCAVNAGTMDQAPFVLVHWDPTDKVLLAYNTKASAAWENTAVLNYYTTTLMVVGI